MILCAWSLKITMNSNGKCDPIYWIKIVLVTKPDNNTCNIKYNSVNLNKLSRFHMEIISNSNVITL